MAFVPVPDGREIVLKGSQNGVPYVNVFHTTGITAPSIIHFSDVLSAFWAWYQVSVLVVQHNSLVIGSITMRDISVANGIEVELVITTGGAGGVSSAPAAANAALVGSWRTANTGRSFRGRTYMGALTSSVFQNAQNVTVSFASDMTAGLTDLIDALALVGETLVVVSKFANKVQRLVGVATEIIGLIVDTKIDSQRRRTAN